MTTNATRQKGYTVPADFVGKRVLVTGRTGAWEAWRQRSVTSVSGSGEDPNLLSTKSRNGKE